MERGRGGARSQAHAEATSAEYFLQRMEETPSFSLKGGNPAFHSPSVPTVANRPGWEQGGPLVSLGPPRELTGVTDNLQEEKRVKMGD